MYWCCGWWTSCSTATSRLLPLPSRKRLLPKEKIFNNVTLVDSVMQLPTYLVTNGNWSKAVFLRLVYPCKQLPISSKHDLIGQFWRLLYLWGLHLHVLLNWDSWSLKENNRITCVCLIWNEGMFCYFLATWCFWRRKSVNFQIEMSKLKYCIGCFKHDLLLFNRIRQQAEIKSCTTCLKETHLSDVLRRFFLPGNR